MNIPTTTAAAVLCALLLGGCATRHVDPADRDTTGAYDGEWIGEVAKPRATRENLAGQWYMTCDWEPFEVYLVVDDGRISVGRLEGRTPVSTEGRFRIDVAEDASGSTVPGNADFVQVFSGNLSGDELRGRYAQFIPSLGLNGCNAPIRFRPHSGSEA